MNHMSDHFGIEAHAKTLYAEATQTRKDHLLISDADDTLQHSDAAKTMTVHIIGAGPAGFLLARALLNTAVTIHIYDKRPENQVASRLQPIGIRDASNLSKILDENEIKEFLRHGGQYTSRSDILRMPIAGLQLCIKKTIENKVTFHYQQNICPIKLGKSLESQSNIVVIAGGKSMAKEISSLFEQKLFPDYQGICRYTWLLNPIQDPIISKELVSFSHGPDWVRIFRTTTEKERLLRYYQYYHHYTNLDKTSELLMTALKNISSQYVALETIVSTDKTDFSDRNPVTSQDIKILPSISTKHITRHTDTGDLPYILLGDVTGPTHPLSLSGMTKIIRVIPALKSLISNYKIYSNLKNKVSQTTCEQYLELIELEFEKNALAMQDYVFFKTLVCIFFEKAVPQSAS